MLANYQLQVKESFQKKILLSSCMSVTKRIVLWIWLHNFDCYLIISLMMYSIFSFIFPSPNKETSLLYHCSFHTWCCSKIILYRRILYYIRLHIKSLWNLVSKTNIILIMQRLFKEKQESQCGLNRMSGIGWNT